MTYGKFESAWGGVGRAPAADLPDSETRIPEFLLGAMLVFDGFDLAGGIPASEVAGTLLVLYGLLAPKSPSLGFPNWAMLPLFSLVAWVGAATVLNHAPLDLRRMGHIAVWALVAYVIASGRVHLASIAKGAVLGLIVGAGTWAAGMGSPYEGRMSGFLGDPNTVGLEIVVFGCIFLGVYKTPQTLNRLFFYAVLALLVWLTVSRTSLAAAILGVLWVLVGERVNFFASTLVGIGVTYWLTTLPAATLKSGRYADRDGSDSFRDRLFSLENALVESSPWTGHGAGAAHVEVGADTFSFHSSYLALRAEGGWIAIAILGVLVIGMVVRLLQIPHGQHRPWFEAAFVGMLVCAANLGEVLLAYPAAVAIGAVVLYIERWRASPDADFMLRKTAWAQTGTELGPMRRPGFKSQWQQ